MYIDISIPIKFPTDSDIWSVFDLEGDHGIFVNQHIVFGTHVDLWETTGDRIEFDQILGNCLVVKIPDSAKKIELGHLLKLKITPGSRVIFKTKNSAGWKKVGHPPTPLGIDMRAAQFLADRNLKLIGIDGWSVDSPKDEAGTIHKILLESGSYLLESLYLDHVAPGNYELIVLPLMMETQVVPCRAVLRKKERL